MNNDLISREALKEHKFLTPQVKVIGGRHGGKLKEQIIQAYQKGWNDCIDAIIDNAPTVKDLSSEIAQKSIELGRKVGQLEGKLERPQGKWIFKKADNEHTDGYICSICRQSYHTKVPYFSEYNFCPSCGADMRGEEDANT